MNLGFSLDLEKIAKRFPNANYNHKPFNAVFVKMNTRDSHITFTIFKNGKVNSAGSKTFENAKLASDEFVLLLGNRLKIPVYNDLKLFSYTCRVNY